MGASLVPNNNTEWSRLHREAVAKKKLETKQRLEKIQAATAHSILKGTQLQAAAQARVRDRRKLHPRNNTQTKNTKDVLSTKKPKKKVTHTSPKSRDEILRDEILR